MSCRLYAYPLAAGELVVAGDDHHYLFRVRRLRGGDEVTLFDGHGHEACATITTIGATTATLSVGEVSAARPAPHRAELVMLVALIKGERMDWAVQKLVELGVAEIIPVAAARCVVKLDDARARKRRERLVAIGRAAARQCTRTTVPEIHLVHDLDDALARVAEIPLKLGFWTSARETSLRSRLPDPPPPRIAVLIGPEGGFTDAEIASAEEQGFLAVGLGPRILRAETAAIAAAAVLAFAVGDLG